MTNIRITELNIFIYLFLYFINTIYMDILYNLIDYNLINYNRCLCKRLKKTASINENNILQKNISIENINLDTETNKILINMIIIHNDLLDKFYKLYTKFMNLIDYIQQTGPKIFNLDKLKINDIKTHIEKKSYKLDIERFDNNIIYYLNDNDKKLLYKYLTERKKDLYNKIEKLINLIAKLDVITLKFTDKLINL
jgi:hypothetical protein